MNKVQKDSEQFYKFLQTMKEAKMAISITKGKVATAKKVVIYGPEGIGKSTLASQFPEPVFIDTEGSTKELDVARYPTPASWHNILDDIDDAIEELPCKTLVIDTADWAEQFCNRDVCKRLNVGGIEDIGYGKGYTYAAEEFAKMLNICNKLINRGVNVVFTAHAQMRKFEQPDEMGAYDRWEMKLSKKCAALLKEWADIVLFCNYKTIVVADSTTKTKKAQGGKRVMYASHHPCWDAKNRYSLPDQMDMDFGKIGHLFENIPEYVPPKDEFVEFMVNAGLTMTDIRAFSEMKGNFPGVTPTDYPEEYKKALMRPESIEKIKSYIKENQENG